MSLTMLYWSIPVILTFHELEEWNIMKWYKQYYIDLPPFNNLTIRTWLLFISLVGFLWTYISILMPNGYLTAIFMELLILVTIQNAIQHICWQILFRAYSPGIIFSSIGLIIGVYVIYQATNKGFLPLWLDLFLLIGLIPTTIQTIKARNEMTKPILVVHLFGIKLANILWNK